MTDNAKKEKSPKKIFQKIDSLCDEVDQAVTDYIITKKSNFFNKF